MTTTELDRELRQALADLASAPPPTGLAARAVRRAVRRRRAIRVASAAACLAVVAVAAVSLTDGTPRRSEPTLEIAAPLSTRERSVVTAVMSIYRGSTPNQGLSMVLNRQTGQYEEVPYRRVLVSPDGTRAVVKGPDLTGSSGRVGILDLNTRQVEWIPDSAGYSPFDWSPDSRRVVLLVPPADAVGPRYAIVDVADPTRTLQLRTPAVELNWTIAFAPDGASLLVPAVDHDDHLRAIVRVDLDGRRLSSVAIDAEATGLLISDSGSRALVTVAGNAGIVVDTITGAWAPVTLAGSPIAWVGDYWLLAKVGDGGESPSPSPSQSHSLTLIDLTGAVILRVRMPVEISSILEVSVGPPSGLPPEAQRFVF